MKITTFIGSSRANGNTEILTDIVTKNVTHRRIYLKDIMIKPIHDLRHDMKGFRPVADDYDQIIEAILESDVLIFSTPVYWYSMTGLMKNMIDRLSQAIRDERYPDLKEHLKTVNAIVVTVGGDIPRIKALPLIQQFKYTFDFLSINFSTYIIGQGRRPGDVVKDEQAVAEALLLNEKLKLESKSNAH
ncbi:flavodoxin family protein [Rummeliibacillus sp. TYF-LIM-RU47]|uniref:flavodoxin family protein n=1 Tax=unclassified Rummeliibacillus TaxID=2622809 RepID=UPI0012393B70|nr:flavodoxin family protein [Rummeliibacillus sp. TYF-LIM-RU47]